MKVKTSSVLPGIVAGVNILADAVSVTMGPKGRNVAIYRGNGKVDVTKDGVTVAEAILELDDDLENIGVQMVKEVASKAGELSGDGTTTATVLARAMIVEGYKNVVAGSNPIDIKRGMDKAVKNVVDYLSKITKEITIGTDQLKQVATISANNDSELGEMFAEAFSLVGQSGVVTVEESPSHETYVNVVTGMQFDRGFISPHFVTTPTGDMCILDNPMYLLSDKKIVNMDDVIPVMELAKSLGRPLVVIAEDIDGQALGQLTINTLQKALPSVCIKAPGYSQSRYEYLTDIAMVTKSIVFSEKTGFLLENIDKDNIDESMFGGSDSISVERLSTTIVNGIGDDSLVANRASELEDKVLQADSEHEKKQLRSRIAKLTGGVGVLYVGADTTVEAKEKRDRADDALCAIISALEEGVVDGGGSALISAIGSIKPLQGDEQIGAQIISKSLLEPLKVIANNAGVNGDIICSEVSCRPTGTGYNAKTGELVSMQDAGIIDPKKVTRVALESASSAAGMVLLTDCAIYL